MMDNKMFTTRGRGEMFFYRVTILFHQSNNTTLHINSSTVLFLFTLIFYT